MKEIVIDASKILYLENSSIFSLVLDFIKNLDMDNLDNLYYSIIENADESKLSYIFDILSRVFYYISYLVNSSIPGNCSYKVIKHYISKEKILLKINVKEL